MKLSNRQVEYLIDCANAHSIVKKLVTGESTNNDAKMLNSTTKILNALRHKECCIECGDSVAIGRGKFVNRTPTDDDVQVNIDKGVNYPHGEYVCEECTVKFKMEYLSGEIKAFHISGVPFDEIAISDAEEVGITLPTERDLSYKQ